MTVNKTRIKQFPLRDNTLTTPEHDKMVLWLLNKKNLDIIAWNQPFCRDCRKKGTIIRGYEVESISSEVPITSGTYNYIIGFWDVVIDIKYYLWFAELPIRVRYYIEVKPKVYSFGETLRQMKLYRVYIKNPSVDAHYCILYTNNSQFTEAFEGQDIYVIEPIENEDRLYPEPRAGRIQVL